MSILNDIMESGRAGVFERNTKKRVSIEYLRYSRDRWLHKHSDIPPVHFNWWPIDYRDVVRFVEKNTYKGLSDDK